MLFRCLFCNDSQWNSENLPLCTSCKRLLLPAPKLCFICGGIECPSGLPLEARCLRPWNEIPKVKSYAAAYFLSKSTFTLLKKWKKRSGSGFDALLLNSKALTPLINHIAHLNPEKIIPVPSKLNRLWALRGHPAIKIATALSRMFRHAPPVLEALRDSSNENKKGLRQAERSIEFRFSDPHRYTLRAEHISSIQNRSVILVDDFMTTGHTLRSAAQVLARSPVSEIHVFALGVRPPLT